MAVAARSRSSVQQAAPPRRRPGRARSVPLRALGAKDRARRSERARARALVSLTVAVIVGTLLLIAACQAIVASQQVRIDDTRTELSSVIATNQNLQLARANIETPANILQLAQHKLGLVQPSSVVYLPPVQPGPSVLDAANASRP